MLGCVAAAWETVQGARARPTWRAGRERRKEAGPEPAEAAEEGGGAGGARVLAAGGHDVSVGDVDGLDHTPRHVVNEHHVALARVRDEAPCVAWRGVAWRGTMVALVKHAQTHT